MSENNQNKEVAEKLSALAEFITIEIEEGSKSGEELNNKSTKLKIIIIVLTSLIAVVLGWSFLGDFGKYSAILLSAILTGLNTWDAFVNYHERSSQEKRNVSKLIVLLKDILLYLHGNSEPSLDEYKKFKAQYDQINEEYNVERDKPEKPPEAPK
ncbi:hypothetical protein [Paenibacillus wynnii]|uniref:SMODS and SLOG-associating 2TM effector domain-containing protein n=1 Tax=Paenibacillus wynnii TaxID=268407 RepID=A0A098MGD5_9BACL|nr:hypothetical protein [Paenibacillus wynnii]KGE16240.1 hypothetical protein PWYN_15880 [Paenibacillus wynnii]KGE21098.1 hypothetical protein PWYN_02890 [Paenibacillus wynnii]